MKNKLMAFKEPQYVVKEEEGLVICILPFVIGRHKHMPLFISQSIMDVHNVCPFNGGTVKGIAKCNGSDVFNLETGKKIARSKAMIKAHIKLVKMLKLMESKFQKKVMSYNNHIREIETLVCIESEKMEELMR